MKDLADASALIAIISNKYLQSPYCMYELTAAWDNGDLKNRIFPIFLPDATDLYIDSAQFACVNFWKDQYRGFEQKVAEIDDAAKEGFLQKLRDREFIYQRVSGAVAAITGMTGITPEKLLESRFNEIIDQVEKQLEAQPGYSSEGKGKSIPEIEPKILNDKQRIAFITQLKNRYQDRLAQKLDHRFAINLELQYSLKG